MGIVNTGVVERFQNRQISKEKSFSQGIIPTRAQQSAFFCISRWMLNLLASLTDSYHLTWSLSGERNMVRIFFPGDFTRTKIGKAMMLITMIMQVYRTLCSS